MASEITGPQILGFLFVVGNFSARLPVHYWRQRESLCEVLSNGLRDHRTSNPGIFICSGEFFGTFVSPLLTAARPLCEVLSNGLGDHRTSNPGIFIWSGEFFGTYVSPLLTALKELRTWTKSDHDILQKARSEFDSAGSTLSARIEVHRLILLALDFTIQRFVLFDCTSLFAVRMCNQN